MRMLRFSAKIIEESPPVRVTCEPVSRIFVQAIVELVVEQPADERGGEDGWPVSREEGKEVGGEHVERLLIGEVLLRCRRREGEMKGRKR